MRTARATPAPTRAGTLTVLAWLLLAATGHAQRGSIRSANAGAARASSARASAPSAAAPAPARPSTGITYNTNRSAGARPTTGQARSAPAATAAARSGSGTYVARGARGDYGTSAAARIQTRPATAPAPNRATAPALNRAAAVDRAYRGPVWATTLPAGARGENYYGRAYYRYANRYYRPYYYGGVPYYGYVWPPYDSYYPEPPVGAITVDAGGESLLYADGSYYETTFDEGMTQYQVVPAPAGLRLPPGSLPAEFATLTVGGRVYVFHGNTFYERVADPAGDVLVVVAEPPGVVKLRELAPDFEPVPVGDLTYFRSGGRHYLSYLDPQGAELYLAVDPPGAAPAAAGAPGQPPPPPAQVITMVIREGTTIKVRVAAEIDCARAGPGDVFEGALAEDLVSDGRLVAARGSRAYGSVVAASAGTAPGSGALELALTDLTIGGRVVAARSDVARFGAGGAPAQVADDGAQLQSQLAAAVDGSVASAPQGQRQGLAPGALVPFRLATTLLVGVGAN